MLLVNDLKKTMKKAICLLFAALLFCSVSACKGSDPNKTSCELSAGYYNRHAFTLTGMENSLTNDHKGEKYTITTELKQWYADYTEGWGSADGFCIIDYTKGYEVGGLNLSSSHVDDTIANELYKLNRETMTAELIYSTVGPAKIIYGDGKTVLCYFWEDNVFRYIDIATNETVKEVPSKLKSKNHRKSYTFKYDDETETITVIEPKYDTEDKLICSLPMKIGD